MQPRSDTRGFFRKNAKLAAGLLLGLVATAVLVSVATSTVEEDISSHISPQPIGEVVAGGNTVGALETMAVTSRTFTFEGQTYSPAYRWNEPIPTVTQRCFSRDANVVLETHVVPVDGPNANDIDGGLTAPLSPRVSVVAGCEYSKVTLGLDLRARLDNDSEARLQAESFASAIKGMITDNGAPLRVRIVERMLIEDAADDVKLTEDFYLVLPNLRGKWGEEQRVVPDGFYRFTPDYTDDKRSPRQRIVMAGLLLGGVALLLIAQHFRSERNLMRAQIDEIHQAERRFFTDNPDPVLTVSIEEDRMGQVLQASSSANELIGSDLPGRFLHEFVDATRLWQLLDSLFGTTHASPPDPGVDLRQGIVVDRDDGGSVAIDASIQATTVDGSNVIVVSFRDAQERIDALHAHSAEAQRRQAEQILAATHHQLSREIVLVGFEIDDLDEVGVDVSSLRVAYERLAKERDSVIALAQLGAEARTAIAQTVHAEDILPVWESGSLEVNSTEPLLGVDPSLLRLAAREVVVFAGRSKARSIAVETSASRLEFAWRCDETQEWESTADDVAVDPLPLTRRVLLAHGAVGQMETSGGIVRLCCRFGVEADASAPERREMARL